MSVAVAILTGAPSRVRSRSFKSKPVTAVLNDTSIELIEAVRGVETGE